MLKLNDIDAVAKFEPWGAPPNSKWHKDKLLWAIKALDVPGSKDRDNRSVLCALEAHIARQKDELFSSDRHRSLIADGTGAEVSDAMTTVVFILQTIGLSKES
jgi:hypothetical protein